MSRTSMHEIVGFLRAATPYEIAGALIAAVLALIAHRVQNDYRQREFALRRAAAGAVPQLLAEEIAKLGLLDTETLTTDYRVILVEQALRQRGDWSERTFKVAALVTVVVALLAAVGLGLSGYVTA